MKACTEEVGEIQEQAIFVNGLPNGWEEKELASAFKAFGDIERTIFHANNVGVVAISMLHSAD